MDPKNDRGLMDPKNDLGTYRILKTKTVRFLQLSWSYYTISCTRSSKPLAVVLQKSHIRPSVCY